MDLGWLSGMDDPGTLTECQGQGFLAKDEDLFCPEYCRYNSWKMGLNLGCVREELTFLLCNAICLDSDGKFSLQGGLEFVLERPIGQRLWWQSHCIWGSFEEGSAVLGHFHAMVSSLKLPWPTGGTDNLLFQKNFYLVLSLVLFESIHPGKCCSPDSQTHWEGQCRSVRRLKGTSSAIFSPIQVFVHIWPK